MLALVVAVIVAVQQNHYSRLGSTASIEVVDVFEERQVEYVLDGTFPILRCRTYIYLSNVGARDSAIVGASSIAAFVPGAGSTRPSVTGITISEPVGLGYLLTDDLGAFQALYVHDASRRSQEGYLQERIADMLVSNVRRLQEALWEDEVSVRGAVQGIALRLLASNVYDDSAIRSLPVSLPSGVVTQVAIESLYFGFLANVESLADADISHQLTLNLSGSRPLIHLSNCRDSYRLDRVDL